VSNKQVVPHGVNFFDHGASPPEVLALVTGRTKTFCALQAILEHLNDYEEVYLAEQGLIDMRAGNVQTLPHEK